MIAIQKTPPPGDCVCPECGAKVSHTAGKPCNDIKCPKCGTAMVRKTKATKKAKQPSAVVQTLILSKKVFKTLAAAKKWIRAHGFKVPGEKVKKAAITPISKPEIDETPTSYRFRQRPPGDFVKGSFRTITITEGVKAVVGRLKVKKAVQDIDVAGDLLDLLL